MNKILSELPLIENGYRRGYIDWKKTSNTITEVLYEKKIYKIYIKEYNRSTEDLTISKYKESGDYKDWDWFYIKSTHFKNLNLKKI